MYAYRFFGTTLSKDSSRENMPMDPMDTLWMSKAPTVSDLVVQPNVTFKSNVPGGNGPISPMAASTADEGIRPDYDTDVLWKPMRQRTKERTVSMDSTDSESANRKFSMNESIGTSSPQPTSPIEAQPRQRRMSISEMLFGSSPSSFSWGISGSAPAGDQPTERKLSITEDPRFKDFMKHQSSLLGEDGVSSSGFKRSNYMKD